MMSLVEKQIDLKCHLAIIELERKESEMKTYLLSTEFSAKLQQQFTVALLSPEISSYVYHIQDQVMEAIKANPSLFGLQDDFLQDPEWWIVLDMVVHKVLGNVWSMIKQKLHQSTGKGNDSSMSIETLTLKLAPKGVQVTPSHWVRLAFLHAMCSKFDSAVLKTQAKKGQFSHWCGGESNMDSTNMIFSTNNEIDEEEALQCDRNALGCEPSVSSSGHADGGEKVMDDRERPADGDDNDYGHLQYWIFVDDQLEALCQHLLTLLEGIRMGFYTQFFTQALLNNNELYNMSAPGKKKRDRGSEAKSCVPGNPLPWQMAIESALTG
ncbi:hypothetical protein FRB94_006355 [Tulasnella sp. JGI-2019a]|nr:hypothetical protein FRB94_006355 [Tulasnella sp. JGI-2019a]